MFSKLCKSYVRHRLRHIKLRHNRQIVCCVTGAPASYKSFLALDWALSVAHGVDWNERPVIQGSVVYLALEGQTGLATRSEAWHKERGLKDTDAPFYAVTTPLSLADEAGDLVPLMDGIADGLGGVNPTMIVVDTLARSFVGADENSSTDMGVFVHNIDLLIERFDCTVLVVHHSGKQTERGMRGSSALRGAVTSEFEVVKTVGSQSVALHVRKQKDVEEAKSQWLTARERCHGCNRGLARNGQAWFWTRQTSLMRPSDTQKTRYLRLIYLSKS